MGVGEHNSQGAQPLELTSSASKGQIPLVKNKKGKLFLKHLVNQIMLGSNASFYEIYNGRALESFKLNAHSRQKD